MGIADHYRILGLRKGASFDDVKASYRKLARRYHPDVNPNNQRAKERFIRVTQAYEALAEILQTDEGEVAPVVESPPEVAPPSPVSTAAPPPPSPVRVNHRLSALEQRLKQESYGQLQALLRQQKFPRAIALVEGLAQRISQDPEVRQWQAIAYQRWGRQLIADGNRVKARIYLEKALKTDPLNKSLWSEVTRDFRQLDDNPE
ncbi:MAG: J domain-containing protein [Cyanobacteria bacterium P01_A01_bin.105]